MNVLRIIKQECSYISFQIWTSSIVILPFHSLICTWYSYFIKNVMLGRALAVHTTGCI